MDVLGPMRRFDHFLLGATLLLAGCSDGAKRSHPAAAVSSSSSGGAGAGGGGGSGGQTSEGGIATLAAPSSFAPQPDGSYLLEDGALFDATQAFYRAHGDDYDFVVLWTDFVVADIWQFALTTRVDIDGIGQDGIYDTYGWPHDWYIEAGSDGRLQAVVFMNHRSLWAESAFTAQDILVHEVGHRWGAHIHLPSLADPFALLDANLSHWALVTNTGGPSALGYGETTDGGDGSFTATAHKPLAYAPLELYAMGLLPVDAPELQDLFYVEAPSGFSPPTSPSGAPWTADSLNANGTVTFDGQRVDLPMSAIVAELGPRLPTHGAAQTDFRFAFVLLCTAADSCSEESLTWLEGERQIWPASFSAATGSRASADTDL